MISKTNLIKVLYESKMSEITSSSIDWQTFLKVAAMNYKYLFAEQILIYAQKPESTACSDITTWNKKLNRWVNKGAKGIALLTNENGYSTLRYVFDVSDTNNRFGKPFELWGVDEKYEDDIIESLENKFGELESSETMYEAIRSATKNILDDNLNDYVEVQQEGMYDLLLDSITYMVMIRCNIDVSMIHHDRFNDITRFNEYMPTLTIGSAANEFTKLQLQEIYQTVKKLKQNEIKKIHTFEADKKANYNKENERSNANDQIRNVWGLPNSNARDEREETSSSGTVFDVTPTISKESQADSISGVIDEGGARGTPKSSTTRSDKQDGIIDGTINKEQPSRRSDEGIRSDEMGRDDEQSETSSDGNNQQGANLHLDIFPSELEQKAEVNSSAFSISREDIDKCLLYGSNFSQGKYRIYETLTKSLSKKDMIDFLKKEYGTGGGTLTHDTGLNHHHDGKGITITGRENEHYHMNWSKVVDELKQLIKDDRWFNSKEKQQYDEWLTEKELEVLNTNDESKIENKAENENIHYDYRLGEKVYLGMDEYEILSIDKEYVRLYDVNYPLFNREMTFEDFDRQVRETPHNEYLIASETVQDEEVQLVDKIIKLHQIEDMEVVRNEYGDIVATDDANMWYNDNLYDFLFDELFVFDDNGSADLINDDELTKLKQYRSKYPSEPKEIELSDEELVNKEFMLNGSRFVVMGVHDGIAELYNLSVKEQTGMILYDTTSTDNVRNQLLDDGKSTFVIEKVEVIEKIPPLIVQDKRNYHITNDELGVATAKVRFQNNIEAIKVIKLCEQENRLSTPKEQEVLSKYVGWGGLSEAFDEYNSSWSNEYVQLKSILDESEYIKARESTLTAFYTPPIVIKAMYQAIENMGFKEGNILEPSCGIGNFMGLIPEGLKESKMYGIELDEISGKIAKQLYQKNNIAIEGFEQTKLPNSFFDVAISNVPFGDFKVSDKQYDKHKFLIHDYFFAKSIDKVRPGGIIAFITSKGTLDKENSSFRKYVGQRADLLGAIRLPEDTFSASANTKVTSDIIFLQKRESMIDIEPDWVSLDVDENGIKMNKYFVDNPEMILGNMEMVSTRFGMDSACIGEGDLTEALNSAILNIHAEIKEYEVQELEEDTSIQATPDIKNFSYAIVDDEVYYRENSRMFLQEITGTTKERVKRLIDIRDTLRSVIDMQLQGFSDEVINVEQKKLNNQYDLFTNKYGLINARGNKTAFQNDDSYYLLCSLEHLDENQNLKRKADIFTKRTILPRKEITKVDNANEALLVSLAEKGKVELDYICTLCDKSVDEVINELRGVIFKVPHETQDVYVTADEYLSGNIREKLQLAKLYAASNSDYQINVEKLMEVLPKDLEASEINVRLGATWIPNNYIKQFMDELLTPSAYIRSNIDVTYFATTAQWNITNKNYDRANIKAHSTYGTSRINAYKILEESLNLKDVRVFDYEVDSEGKKVQVLNKKETAIAQAKQEQIKTEFADWIWKNPTRRNDLVRMYNDKFNSIRNRDYDGSHLVFHGMNPEIILRSHQRNAIARTLYGGNSLLAHEVGAGKTFTMVASAMESKRLGLCSKSLFVVPNHLVEQFSSEFLQLYPSANILVTTKKDFQKANRKRFCSRIATGDYDAVIIAHSQFEKIPMSVESQARLIEQQMDSITQGIGELKRNHGERFSIKQLEKTKKGLQQRLDKLNDTSRKDDVVTFEELGIDRIYVDEAHYYKNLFLYTKMRNVGGIAQVEAQKSSDLFMKCRYLDEITGGKGVVFATGTPVSNSMVELYTMQRYLQYEQLVADKLEHFDSWASTFGETTTAIELSPEGNGYRAKTRFAKFYNLPELMSVFKEVADIQTSQMLKLPVPKANYHNVVIEASDIQKEMVQELSERAERIRNKMVTPQEDNMLKITNDGRKLALDQRLMNDMLPNEENGKVSVCANNVFDVYQKHNDKKLTQLVFCDLSTPSKDKFNVYGELKKQLVEKGISEDEIAFIHHADTDVRKKEMFSKVRTGQIRVLMGSTQKMGAGTNVQDKLIALHDLDCPWRPSDLIQRSGRIIRQGNTNEEVEIYRYVTEGTFDAYLFQLVENKQKFVSQIMTDKAPVRFAEDIDEAALSYGEIKALASGNPLILEKTTLDSEVAKLKLLKQSYLSQKYSLEDKIIKHYPLEITRYENLLRNNKCDIEHLNANDNVSSDKFQGMKLEGIMINDKEMAGKKLLEICKKKTNVERVEVGEYKGFKIEISFDTFDKSFNAYLKNELSYKCELGSDVFGNITRLDNTLANIDKQNFYQSRLDEAKVNLDNAKADVEKPFNKEQELQEKMKRLTEVNKSLDLGEKENIALDEDEKTEVAKEKQQYR